MDSGQMTPEMPHRPRGDSTGDAQKDAGCMASSPLLDQIVQS